MPVEASLSDQLALAERLLQAEQAHRADLEVRLGYASREHMRLLQLARRCRYQFLYRPGDPPTAELLRDLQHVEKNFNEQFRAAQSAYSAYLATFVEPHLPADAPPKHWQWDLPGILAKAVFLAYIATVTVILYTCSTNGVTP